MTSPLFDDATRAQMKAARPSRSSWVTANAGSGKTRVLTDRVARLLLRPTDPQKILCLTYTTAAAAEMQNRLFARLGAWSMLDDDHLRAALVELGVEADALDEAGLAQARTLFARALETPGGLKIQTIHSFCDMLLRRFPLEADVSPGFEVLDDRQAAQLRSASLERLSAEDPDHVVSNVAQWLDHNSDGLLQAILRHRAVFAANPDEAALRRALGALEPFDRETRLADVRAMAASLDLDGLIDALNASSKPTDEKAKLAFLALNNRATGTARLYEIMRETFLTQSNGLRKTVITKAPSEAFPPASDICRELGEAVLDMRQAELAEGDFRRSFGLHLFGKAFLTSYDAAKQAIGRLDYDDLISKAGKLVTERQDAAWVLYRLDGGLDHILVDEAQDTSPAQWTVIQTLSAEFFASQSSANRPRTIFVVGDEKQSIYSFQGAEPAAFDRMRLGFLEALAPLDGLEMCDLLYSFRSAPAILSVVDTICAGGPELGLSEDITHRAFKDDMPGRVELWDFRDKPGKSAPVPWFEPVDVPEEDKAPLTLACDLAVQVHRWIEDGEILATKEGTRPVTAGDFLVLVQSRSAMFHKLIAELKRLGVPVAGADRLNLSQELAVKDLIAALRFLATPDDDLSLAEFLRSPLCGLSESDLFGLCAGRGKTVLWSVVRQSPLITQDREHAALWDMLTDMRGQSDFLRPYDLLERILTRHKGRDRLIAQLGPEASEAVDALLDQALAYERVEAPSLTGFLDWFAAQDVEIKRQMEGRGNQVRVMTVHGAKGLEAPIVILPDTAAREGNANRPPVLKTAENLPLWRSSNDQSSPAMMQAKSEADAQDEAERIRLLYVAMTRAESWLIVCGAGMLNDQCWYSHVQRAFADLPAHPHPLGQVIEENWTGSPLVTEEDHRSDLRLPEWTNDPCEKPVLAVSTLAPSGLGGAHSIGGEGDENALQRGTDIHKLLEHLPTLPRSDWATHAASLLPGRPLDDILPEVTGVLDAPGLSHLFVPGALAEVSVTAPLDVLDGRQILGQIDRLIITDDRILAVDFKSNRIVPDRPDATPEAILRQMGAYAEALTQIYPGHRIETAILWTRSAELMELPHDLVSAALSRTTSLDVVEGDT